MKKLLLFLLTAAMLIPLVPGGTAHADGAELLDGLFSTKPEPTPSPIGIYVEKRNYSYKSYELDIIEYDSLQLRAVCADGEEPEKLIWKSSDESIATVDKNGLVSVESDEGGSVNIFCYTSDSSGRSCALKLELVKGINKISLEHYVGYTVRENSIVTLNPRYLDKSGEAYTPSSPALKWSVLEGEEYAEFAKSSSGTLCTKTVARPQTVRIRVESAENRGIFAEMNITVNPILESISIFKGDQDVSSEELSITSSAAVSLTAKFSPAQVGTSIKWSSSLSSVSVVDGLVTAKGPCSVVITAAAADGSGKYATVTINFT